MARRPLKLPAKVAAQIAKMRLPTSGSTPFRPQFDRNRRGELILARRLIESGPRAGTPGLLDEQGRIWVRDDAHAGLPDHWDVQLDEGADYVRVGYDGEVVDRSP